MDVLAVVMALVAATAGALLFLYAWTALGSRIHPQPDEVLVAVTEDGHQLPVYRHRPPPAYGPPRAAVLCMHGLGANHFNLDFPGSANLARWLADAGNDVFVASFRADGDASGPPHGGQGYSFDAHVNHDVPALLELVKTASGFGQVHLVGHSMGGMLAYAFAGVHGDADLVSITAIGSPVGFQERDEMIADLKPVAWLIKKLPWLPVRWLARAAVPFLALLTETSHIRKQLNTDNVDWALVAQAMWHSLSHVPRDLVLQFEDWILHDAFRSVDGTTDYREAMKSIRVPVCILAGAMDVLARPHNALRAETLVGSFYKEVAVLGPDEGCRMAYGHIDLVFGLHAPQEVFARVAQFISRAGDGALGITSKDVGIA